MKLQRLQNIDEVRDAARRYLPRIVFDYVEGGVEDERCVSRNSDALAARSLLPNYLVDIERRNQQTELFGVSYASPFGIAPTGMAGIVRRNGDVTLATAAAESNIPFIISGVATGTIEDIARVSPRNVWFQVYMARDRQITFDQITIAWDAGIRTLVVTVDVPVTSKRERDIRNGWVRPYKPTLPAMIEAASHPLWVARFVQRGIPLLSNWRKYSTTGKSALDVAAFVATQIPSSMNWSDIEAIRKAWKGTLVVKGVLAPADAQRLVAMGVDGLVVSNHGGRQFDRAPASIDMLPVIHDAVNGAVPLIFDSGIRRGSDIVVALSLGASFALVGRAPIYGLAAGAKDGVKRVIQILSKEIDTALAQLGCPDIANLTGTQFHAHLPLLEQKRSMSHA